MKKRESFNYQAQWPGFSVQCDCGSEKVFLEHDYDELSFHCRDCGRIAEIG